MSGEEAVQDDVELDDLFAMDEPTADLNGVAGDEAPAGDTSAAAPEPVAEPEPDKKPGWDKDRQLADTTRALQREKEEKAEMREQLSTLQQQLQELTERIPKPSEPEPEPDEIDSLDEENADAAQIVKAMKYLKQQIAAKDAVIKDLSGKQSEREQREAEESERSAQQTAQQRLEELMTTLDKDHGTENRNEVLKRAKQYILDEGYDAEKLPPESTVRTALRMFSREVAQEKKPAKAKPKTPAIDSATGGGSGMEHETGTMDQVLASMRKAGTIR